MSFRLVLATRNSGKVQELRAKLDGLDVEIVTVDEFEHAPEVDEDQDTLAGNAKKKAMAVHQATGHPALADDTGLEVYMLDMKPGVHSARYAGDASDDAANRAKLISDLDGQDDRAARFRTVLAYADEGVVRLFEGSIEGAIAEAERGNGGFGYDALFLPEGHDHTFAEMDAATKNSISHRAQAVDKFAGFLRVQRS
ncbi:MAG: RdgB/HAM1 family non-canonical purine NTP pyrophosphatase [Bacteroidota bacterium]